MAKIVEITGQKFLDKKLAELSAKAAKRAGTSAVRAGMTEIAKGIRSEVPVGPTKNLKKSIGSKVAKSKGGARKGIAEARAGVNVGKKQVKHAPHSHLVAIGTGQRTTKSGANRGVMPANDFVKRGFNKAQAAAKAKMLAKLGKEIDKAAKKK